MHPAQFSRHQWQYHLGNRCLFYLQTQAETKMGTDSKDLKEPAKMHLKMFTARVVIFFLYTCVAKQEL